jgi:hypothetical protein
LHGTETLGGRYKLWEWELRAFAENRPTKQRTPTERVMNAYSHQHQNKDSQSELFGEEHNRL